MDDQKVDRIFECKAMEYQKPDVVKVKCSHCERVYVGRIPKGGDGSVFLPRRHTYEGPRNGSPCPGNIREAEIVLSDQPVPAKPTKEFKAAFHRMAEKAFTANVTLSQILLKVKRMEERNNQSISFVLHSDGSGTFEDFWSEEPIVEFANMNELQGILITEQ